MTTEHSVTASDIDARSRPEAAARATKRLCDHIDDPFILRVDVNHTGERYAVSLIVGNLTDEQIEALEAAEYIEYDGLSVHEQPH